MTTQSRQACAGLLGLLVGLPLGFWGASLTPSPRPAERVSQDDRVSTPAPPSAPTTTPELAPAPRLATPSPNRLLLPVRAYQQTTPYTCGPASILTLLRYYERNGDEMRIAREAKCSREKGTSPQNMVAWLEGNGFDVTWGEKGTLRMVRDNLARGVPTLVEWIDWGGHWVVVVGYDTRGTETPRDDLIIFADPADSTDGQKDGLTEFPAAKFQSMWFDAFLFDRPMHRVYITATPRRGPNTP